MGKSCKVEEKKAKTASDKDNVVWDEYMLIIDELQEVTMKGVECMYRLYRDVVEQGYGMDLITFQKRSKECADLDEQEEELRVRLFDVKIRYQKAGDAWRKAHEAWKDCIHKQTK